MKNFWNILFRFLFILLMNIKIHARLLQQHKFSTSLKNSKIVVDHATGDVYVASGVFLSHLSANLTLVDQIDLDSELFGAFIQLLLVDYAKRKLLVCYSVQEGLCLHYDLDNITASEPANWNNTGGSGPVVAKYTSNMTSEIVLGVTHPHEHQPFISIKSFSNDSKNPSALRFSDANIFSGYRNTSEVKFVHMFEYQNAFYFLVVMTNRTIPEVTSMIFKICKQSAFPIHAIPISCTNTDEPGTKDYTILLSASFEEHSATLFAAFGNSTGPVSSGTHERSQGARICALEIKDINDELNYITSECNKGVNDEKDFSIMDLIVGPGKSCKTPRNDINVLNTCSNPTNMAVQGRKVNIYNKEKVHVPNRLIKTLISYNVNKEAYILMYDDTGQSMTYSLTPDKKELKLLNIDQTSGSFIDADFDESKRKLYVLQDRKVILIDLDPCQNPRYNNCSSCVQASPFNCYWENGTCTSIRGEENTCPPKIRGVVPTEGEVLGNTDVTIYGENLGGPGATITIAICDKPCRILENLNNNTHVRCRISPSNTVKSCSILINVSGRSGTYIVKGSDSTKPIFEYKRMNIFKISPLLGPQSGGTTLTVFGENFNLISNLSILIGNIGICSVVSTSYSQITCVTSRYNNSNQTTRTAEEPLGCGSIILQFNYGSQRQAPSPFCYWNDPNISDIFPSRTMISGGLKVNVKGTNLNVIEEPKMGIELLDSDYQTDPEDCEKMNSTNIICTTPSLANLTDGTDEVNGNIFFVMDGVSKVRDFAQNYPNLSSIKVHKDPEIQPFVKDKQLKYLNKKLDIKGSGLKEYLLPEDIRITTGNISCPLVTKTDTELTCRPNVTQDLNQTYFVVRVKIGNLEYSVGHVSVVRNVDGNDKMDPLLPLTLVYGG